jgi:hypothetical protein
MMNLPKTDNRRRFISGVGAILIGASFLLGPLGISVTAVSASSQTMIALAGFKTLLNMVFMIAAVFGITQLLRKRADWIGLLGAASTLIGWTVAARIGVMLQLRAVSQSGVEAISGNLTEVLRESAPAVLASIFPVGVFFPLGLITLGLALAWARPIRWWIGLLLALGGVLFPIGRAWGYFWAVVACDIILGSALILIGWQILARPELWRQSSFEENSTV